VSARISTPSFHKKVPGQLPSELAEVLGPIVETIGSLTEKIKDYDRRIEELAAQRCPETELLRQVSGVASLTALTFVGEQCHYILGPFAPDSDLRRHGEKIAQRGGKNAKSGQWWRWPENSPCCFIASGSRGRSTKRCAMPGVWGFKQRRELERAKRRVRNTVRLGSQTRADRDSTHSSERQPTKRNPLTSARSARF
jgi:hypothetical protein